jgi:GNAT superfamily N-acetyltransferase
MVEIRLATIDDAHLLPGIERSSGELFRQCVGLEWIADDDVQSVAQHRSLIATGTALVAEQRGHGLVGFLNGEIVEGGLHIWQIAVHGRHQGLGIGRLLIAQAQAAAARQGADKLTLTTFRDVPWNAPYYGRLGFRILGANEITPRLRAILERERQAGLPMAQRCAMMMPLQGGGACHVPGPGESPRASICHAARRH